MNKTIRRSIDTLDIVARSELAIYGGKIPAIATTLLALSLFGALLALSVTFLAVQEATRTQFAVACLGTLITGAGAMVSIALIARFATMTAADNETQ